MARIQDAEPAADLRSVNVGGQLAGTDAAMKPFEGLRVYPGFGQIQKQGKARHETVGAFSYDIQGLNAFGGHMPSNRNSGRLDSGAGAIKI